MEIISRKEAIEKGLKRYFTGKPCKRGHVSERYVSTGNCTECMSNRSKSKEKKNYDKLWYTQNKDYKKKYDKEYRDLNREQFNEARRQRYNTDCDLKTLILCRNMLRRTLDATNSTKDTRTFQILGYCNMELKKYIESNFLQGMSWDNYGDWHIDHIYPVIRYIKDGEEDPSIINSLNNLIPMWAEHNFEKKDKTLKEYLEYRDDLAGLYGKFL